MKIIDRVAKVYSLGSIKHLQALYNGKTSAAWQVETLFQGFMPKNQQDLTAYLNEFLALSGIQITDRHLFLMTVQLWLVKGLLIVINEQASLAGGFQNAIELVSSLV